MGGKCPSATRERNLQKSFSQSFGHGCVSGLTKLRHTWSNAVMSTCRPVSSSTFSFCRCYSIYHWPVSCSKFLSTSAANRKQENKNHTIEISHVWEITFRVANRGGEIFLTEAYYDVHTRETEEKLDSRTVWLARHGETRQGKKKESWSARRRASWWWIHTIATVNAKNVCKLISAQLLMDRLDTTHCCGCTLMIVLHGGRLLWHTQVLVSKFSLEHRQLKNIASEHKV